MRFDGERWRSQLDWFMESALLVKNREHSAPTLWNTFQTVQGNLLKGGIEFQNAKAYYRYMRPIKAPKTDIDLNRKLWDFSPGRLRKEHFKVYSGGKALAPLLRALGSIFSRGSKPKIGELVLPETSRRAPTFPRPREPHHKETELHAVFPWWTQVDSQQAGFVASKSPFPKVSSPSLTRRLSPWWRALTGTPHAPAPAGKCTPSHGSGSTGCS
jgi:hypothetical protein